MRGARRTGFLKGLWQIRRKCICTCSDKVHVVTKYMYIYHSSPAQYVYALIEYIMSCFVSVVVADLLVGGKSFGPHAFFLSLRQEQDGDLVPGVTVGDMGLKTVGNDLDNAWVSESLSQLNVVTLYLNFH